MSLQPNLRLLSVEVGIEEASPSREFHLQVSFVATMSMPLNFYQSGVQSMNSPDYPLKTGYSVSDVWALV